MKSAIKRRKSTDTATDSRRSVPATSVRCKYCNRSFATISAEGGLHPSVPHEETCASCEPFLGLYDTRRAREQEHTALLNRGPKHHGRVLAHEQFRKARVVLENFLVSIEAPNNASFDVAQAAFANHSEPESLERAHDPDDVSKHVHDQGILDGASSPGDYITPSASSPTTKRKLAQASGNSKAERKRIKFGEDVEERPECRRTLEYYRGAKEYVPGRYAVTEGSEYEDTSGSTVSFAKFTGQKKVGSKFVDITPKEQTHDGKEASSAVQKTSRGGGRKDLDGLGEPDSTEKEKDESQMNSRELRLSRRARSTTPPVAVKPRRTSPESGVERDPSEEAVDSAPASIVSLKVLQLPEDDAVVNRHMSSLISEHTTETQLSSANAGSNETAIRATKSAVISEALSNIERELACLQHTVASPEYVDMVSKAVHGCREALEPLKQLGHANLTAQAGIPQGEDDSIYFEASDGTGGVVPDLQQNEPLNIDEVIPRWSEAPFYNADPNEPYINSVLNANLLDDMPKGDKQNLSETLELRQTGNGHGSNTGVPVSGDETTKRETEQNRTQLVPTIESQNANGVSQSTGQDTTRSSKPDGVETATRRSGEISSTVPQGQRSPEDELNKAPTRPTTSAPLRSLVPSSRRSPASSIPTPLESEQYG